MGKVAAPPINGFEAVYSFLNSYEGEKFQITFTTCDEHSYLSFIDILDRLIIEKAEDESTELTIYFKNANSHFSNKNFDCYLSSSYIGGKFVGYTVYFQSVKKVDQFFTLELLSMNEVK